MNVDHFIKELTSCCDVTLNDDIVTIIFMKSNRESRWIEHMGFKDISIKCNYLTYPQRFFVVKNENFDREYARRRQIYPDVDEISFSQINGKWDLDVVFIVEDGRETIDKNRIIKTYFDIVYVESWKSTITLKVNTQYVEEHGDKLVILIKNNVSSL